MIKRSKIIPARIHGIKMSNLIRNINQKIDVDGDKNGVEVERRLEENDSRISIVRLSTYFSLLLMSN